MKAYYPTPVVEVALLSFDDVLTKSGFGEIVDWNEYNLDDEVFNG